MSRAWHVSVQACPPEVEHGAPVVIDGQLLTPLRLPAARSEPMACSFEEAAAALERLPRMFLEPDGSFVWTSTDAARPWQLDGVLYDDGRRLLYVELKGNVPPPQLNALLAAFGWPAEPLMFQLLREAVYLAEQEFRRWAFDGT